MPVCCCCCCCFVKCAGCLSYDSKPFETIPVCLSCSCKDPGSTVLLVVLEACHVLTKLAGYSVARNDMLIFFGSSINVGTVFLGSVLDLRCLMLPIGFIKCFFTCCVHCTPYTETECMSQPCLVSARGSPLDQQGLDQHVVKKCIASDCWTCHVDCHSLVFRAVLELTEKPSY